MINIDDYNKQIYKLLKELKSKSLFYLSNVEAQLLCTSSCHLKKEIYNDAKSFYI